MKKNKALKKRKRRESGQSLVEFVLVLPLFAAILMGIMDFGWLFYNYIGVENSARNAARVACIEYETVNVNFDNTSTEYDLPVVLARYKIEDYETYGLPKYKVTKTIEDPATGGQIPVDYYEIQDLLDAATAELPKSVTFEDVTVKYSSDEKANGQYTGYRVKQKRPNGDVTVTVHAKMHVLTPILGMFSDHMQFNLTSQSTYKVERASQS